MTGRHRARRGVGGTWSRTPGRPRATGTDLHTLPRRSRAQAGPLVLLALLVAVGTALAAAAPRAVALVEDQAVRTAVEDAGRDADLVLSGPVGYEGSDGGLDREPAGTAGKVAAAVRAAALTTFGPVLGEPLTTEVSRALRLREVAGERTGDAPAPATGETSVRLAWQAGAEIAWVSGRSPQHAPGADPEVALSQETAAALGAVPGSVLVLSGADGADLRLRVTGVFRTSRTDASSRWVDAPEVLRPRVTRQGPATTTQVAALLPDTSLRDGLEAVGPRDVQRVVRIPVTAGALSAERADRLLAELPAVQAAPAALGQAASSSSLFTGLDDVLRRVRADVDAARAQSLALGVAAGAGTSALLVLAARVLARRREPDLVLRRARGSALPATLVELGAEAVLVAAAGAAAGVALAAVVVPGPLGTAALVPAAVAVLASPVAGLLVARAAGDPPRDATGAVDGRPLRRRARPSGPAGSGGTSARGPAAGRRGRRLAAEGALLVAAVLAVAARRDGGTDLLAASAATLVAGVVAVVVARLVPLVLRAAGPLAARSRGAVPVLGLARAREAGAAPAAVVCLTLCAALVVVACAVGAGARRDAVVASWTTVGGDVAVRAAPGSDLAEAAAVWAASPGVTAVVAARVEDDVQAATEQGPQRVRVLVAPPADLERLAVAARAGGAGPGGGTVVGTVTVAGLWGADRTLEGLGVPVPSAGGAGGAGRPTVVVDPAALADAGQDAVRDAGSPDAGSPDAAWLTGPGAADAVRDAPPPPGSDVAVRADVLADLGSGVLLRARLGVAVVAAALLLALSVLAALQAAAAGGPARRRALDTLRTLGLGDREARAVAVAELLPAAATAVVLGAGGGLLAASVVVGGGAVRATLGWLLGAAGLTAAAVVSAVVVLAVVEQAGSRDHRVGASLRIPEP
ncbi:hypothetical protein [Cellulomonas sp. C5510]|uniref:hypothetical protein n=1 Tax=Cellulomonas sp. C5510 TaxID=2871170 RepID=UPI001C972444|nr:hypothetical protein [Cellulomonas sp. C5510]QZN84143.1 hypothetical protein K5O09_09505 [Cellulomonas sp. C5510]